MSPNTVKITSSLATANDKLPAEKITAIKEIYDKIQAMNNSCLKFKIE